MNRQVQQTEENRKDISQQHILSDIHINTEVIEVNPSIELAATYYQNQFKCARTTKNTMSRETIDVLKTLHKTILVS